MSKKDNNKNNKKSNLIGKNSWKIKLYLKKSRQPIRREMEKKSMKINLKK